jgi:5,6-dimethylbenzimidazole synthase
MPSAERDRARCFGQRKVARGCVDPLSFSMAVIAAPDFDPAFREALKSLLVWRRDVRRFRTDPIDPKRIEELIDAACLAPSVGYSQPWRFVLVESGGARAAVRASFAACNRDALGGYTGDRARSYAELKLAGLDDAPVQLAVFADTATAAGHGLGRRTSPQMLQYSVVTAVHTLWLVARAWGIGVGWVSILDPVDVRDALGLSPTWDLVAYLCIGYPDAAYSEPELRRVGWQDADPVARQVLRR